MPNSFTVFPNVLPGNVTIGGNLTVAGDQLRIGAASPFVRVGKDLSGNGVFQYNLGFDTVTPDVGADFALRQALNVVGGAASLTKYNTSANSNVMAVPSAIFTDYTSHAHTGTVTEDTIVTKVIRAGIIGANGGYRVLIVFNVTAQVGANSTLHFYLGGGTQLSFVATTVSKQLVDITVGNRNAQNSQVITSRQYNLTTGVLVTANFNTAAVDYSVDETVQVTLQSSNAGDAQNLEAIIVTLENSFGPV